MKRISPRRREYQIRVTEKRNERRLRSLRAKQEKRRRAHEAAAFAKNQARLLVPPGAKVVVAPEFFNVRLNEHRKRLLAFIHRIRDITVRDGRLVYVDFTKTRRMYPGGTLLFLAEIDRIKRASPEQRVLASNYPSDRIVEQVLQQVGILDIFGKPRRLVEADFDETVRHWQFATGTMVEGQKLEPFVGELEGRLAPALTRGLFVGLTEAMTNSTQHAYLGERGDGISSDPDLRRWWMFSQEKDGRVDVAFCDLGIGIPRSLDNSKDWDQSLVDAVMSRLGFRGRTESNLIRAALELSRSRTQLSHRGKGLPQIFDVIRSLQTGFLQIHSNRGMFLYNADDATEFLQDFHQSVQGTLILWQIPLTAQLRARPVPSNQPDQLKLALGT